MHRPSRKFDVELGLRDLIHIDESDAKDNNDNNHKHVTISVVHQKPHSDGEFLDQETRREAGAGGEGEATDDLPENISLAEPIDELCEPRTPPPAHLPRPPTLTDENESENTDSTTFADNIHETGELLKTEGARSGHDETGTRHAEVNDDTNEKTKLSRKKLDSAGKDETDAKSVSSFNKYQQKKNLAQGMMDLALFSANANQLRYVLESSNTHRYYYPSLVLIALSLVLQVLVGVGLIMNSRQNVKTKNDMTEANKINNMILLGVFLVTIVNVFITSFSPGGTNTVQQAA